MVKVVELNDVNFDSEVKYSSLPVLVDFYAIWCEHCKKQLPILDELAVEFSNRAKIAKMNVEESKIKSVEFGVSSVPGIFVFKNGNVVEHLIGLHSQKKLSEILNKYLNEQD